MTVAHRHKNFSFASDGFWIEGVAYLPAGTPKAAAFVAHPHPLYGGDMNNHVVVSAAEELSRAGVAACRFNFSGVGRSEGAGRADASETRQAWDSLCALINLVRGQGAPRLISCGYSYGAWIAWKLLIERPGVFAASLLIAPPISLFEFSSDVEIKTPIFAIAGEQDDFAPSGDLKKWAASSGSIRLISIPNADHFLFNAQKLLRETLRGAINEILK